MLCGYVDLFCSMCWWVTCYVFRVHMLCGYKCFPHTCYVTCYVFAKYMLCDMICVAKHMLCDMLCVCK